MDDNRDGKAMWAKVGLPDAGRQARVLFWIVPEPARAKCPQPAATFA